MNKNKTIPQENIEHIVRRSLRKGAISAGKIEPSKFHPHACHLCGWPNILHKCIYCKKSVCIKCKIPDYDYCHKCISNVPHLVQAVQANALIENKNCCSIM